MGCMHRAEMMRRHAQVARQKRAESTWLGDGELYRITEFWFDESPPVADKTARERRRLGSRNTGLSLSACLAIIPPHVL